MSDDFVIDILKSKYTTATEAQIKDAAERARAQAIADGGGIAGLYAGGESSKKAALSIIDRAMSDAMAAAKLKGTSDFAPAELEYMADVKETYCKPAVRAGNQGIRRQKFIAKYGLEKHNEAMKLTGATTDLRVAGRNPWKNNKAVKRALKAAALEPSDFNLTMHADQAAKPKPPKVKLAPDEIGPNLNLTKLGQLYLTDPARAKIVAQRSGIKLP